LVSDNTTNDLSGNSYNVQSGTVSFSTDGKKGTHSASFNGSSNYLQYSNGSFLNQAISFSYSMWVKPSSLSGIQTIFEEGGTVNGVAVRLNGSTLEAAVREGSAQNWVLFFPSDGSWHHVALTYNNGNVILYLGVALQPYLLDLENWQHIPMFNILDIQMEVLLVLLLPIIMVD
jgi:hypothetical protein